MRVPPVSPSPSLPDESSRLPVYGSTSLRRCIGWLAWGPALLSLPSIVMAAVGLPLGWLLKLAPVVAAGRAAGRVLHLAPDHRFGRAMAQTARTQGWVAIAPDLMSLAVLALLQSMQPTRMVGALLGLGCALIHLTMGGVSYRGLRRLSRGEPDPTFDAER